MADNEKKDDPFGKKSGGGSGSGGLVSMLKTVGIYAAIAGAAAGGGFFAGLQFRAAAGPGDPAVDINKPETLIIPENKPREAIEPDELADVKMEPITTNLGDEGSRRFVKVAITLSVIKGREDEVTKLITEKKSAIIKNWLIAYFSELKLTEVNGPKHRNKMRREIEDVFNQKLYPNEPPVIRQVWFEEFMIQ